MAPDLRDDTSLRVLVSCSLSREREDSSIFFVRSMSDREQQDKDDEDEEEDL